jgi:hypothetical protein
MDLHNYGKPDPDHSEKLNPNTNKVKIQELWRLTMQSSRAVDAHNGGVGDENEAVDGL